MKFSPKFSLRTLIAAITLICVILGGVILSNQLEYRRESALAKRIEKNRATVLWDAKTPAWLRWLGNPQFFQRIVQINDASVGDVSDIDELDQLPNLQKISISIKGSDLNEVVVDRLAKSKTLDTLYIVFSDDDPRFHTADGTLDPKAPMFNQRTMELVSKLRGVKIGGVLIHSLSN